MLDNVIVSLIERRNLNIVYQAVFKASIVNKL